jgi:hypothetical protein
MYYYYYYYLLFSKQEEALDTQNTNKPVTKRLGYNTTIDIQYRRKRDWTTRYSDQQHLPTYGTGQSLCDRLNGTARSLNYSGNFVRVCGRRPCINGRKHGTP